MRSLSEPSFTDRAVLQERIAHLVQRRRNTGCDDAVYAARHGVDVMMAVPPAAPQLGGVHAAE